MTGIGTGLARRLFAPLLVLSAVIAAPAQSLVPASAPAEAPTAQAAPEPQIASTQDNDTDPLVTARIQDIFAQLPSLAAVQVSVREGVVSLSGTVPDAAARERAEAIASRVSGVVTVENSLERDVSVDRNLGALGGLSEKVDNLVAIAPLIGAAIAVALIISLIGYLIAGFSGLWRRIAPNSFLAELIASAIRFVFVVGGLVIALDMIGAGALLGAVLGGAGVIGIALGFAMRDTIENYVASLMLSLRQPFRANDHILIDDLEGRVIRLTSRATILMTLDGNHLRVPNSTVFKAVIVNYTRNPQRRFDFDLGIDAEDDASAARRLGIDVLRGLDFVLDNPPPNSWVVQVGDSNIVIKFLGWIDQRQTDWQKARSGAIPAVKDALEGAGFALPEPIYRLRFDANAPLPLGTAHITETFEDSGDNPVDASGDYGQQATKPAPRRDGAKPAPGQNRTSPVGDLDVSPDTEVEKMVAAERSVGSQDNDLLDSNKPVE